MSGTVPVYRSQERIQRQPVVDTFTGEGGAMAALSRSMGELQNVLAATGRDMQQAREEREIGEDRRDILTRPMRDEAGNYMVPEPGEWGTRRGRLRNEAILNRLADEAQIEGREAAVRFRQEAGADPARFQALFRGWAEGRTSQMPEWVRQQAGSAFSRIANEHVQSLALQQVAREDRNQAAGWEAHLQVRTQELEGLARAGRMDSPEYRTAHEAVIGLIDRGVREGRLSPEAAEVQRQALSDRVTGVAVVRAGMDRLAEGATAEEVLRDFDAEADRRALPLNQRERLRNLLEARVNERRAVQAEQRTEVGIEWTDMRARITGGVPVEATEVDALARRAEGAGARATAAEIRRTQEVYSNLRDAQATSLPELTRQYSALVQRVATDPNASSRDAILAQLLGEAVTRRREAMRRDPLGTAAATHRLNPNGGELIPLDMSSPEKLGEGLAARAQQARRLGALEGMADSMPVLTAAEAAQLGGLVRNGTRDQQMALLTSLNRLPADTMRRTMEGMLPGQENERDPRVLSFMAAAGVMQRDSRLAIEIINGMERLRATPAPSLNGAEVDRFIEERVGQAYGTNPAAYAAVSAAARAVYAERAATGMDPSEPGASRRDPGLAQRFDSGLMRRVLEQVAPTITYNGQMIPPPVRNGQVMTEAAFREQMQGIPAHVLSGVRAANGSPITPDMVRRDGALIAVGEGRYGLTIRGFRVNGPDGRPFVVDMRQDWPAPPAAGDPNAPRGIRNNNPLNLEFRSGQPGVVGNDGRFGRYQTMEDGLFAGAQQILRWVDRGDTTLTALITRWAPPSDNNDTAAYVQRVARDTGLNPSAPINWRDPAVLGSVIQSMAHHENGQPVDAEAVRRAVARVLG
ncbi:hypothetical protein GXW74_19775 [Roseomonas eburnea]|uniref:Uncharacterized protein n=1 Tax=Neoroseomonas eburnea TaxID=1346889 RepID=A0A9X9XGA5_9PROT|nr:hypothetical protein [Neoroseomonas eburnea]MBR0682741.1 hypothetical protein [Neoroseomonas eburnea]